MVKCVLKGLLCGAKEGTGVRERLRDGGKRMRVDSGGWER